MITISKRLRTIHDFVDQGEIVGDIGSDHALLPCALIESKTCDKVYACDIAQGPLDHAKATISQYGMSDYVETILVDGLDLLPEDVTTIIIAGMGYDTITYILNKNMDRVMNCDYLILQSNNHVDDLRRWIHQHRLHLVDETMVKDGHYYQILKVKIEEGYSLSEEDIYFGKYIHDLQLFMEYWQKQISSLNNIIKKVSKDHPKFQECVEKIHQIESKLYNIKSRM